MTSRASRTPLLRALALFAPGLAVIIGTIVVACTPSIGDKCNISTDCSQMGDRLCDSTQPGGYCTTFNCEPDTCSSSICVAFNPTLGPLCGAATSGEYPRFERTFCMAPCSNNGDCRDEYECVDLQIPANQIQRQAQVVDLQSLDGGYGFSVCMASTCADNIQDGVETDVDCGGDICSPCGDKKMCGSGSDCFSSLCANGLCVEPSCTDGMQDNLETDVDCGGIQCAPCSSGKKCAVGTDCQSGGCGTENASGICTPGNCHDGVKDGSETDVDCGGTCTPCLVGLNCNVDSDCATSNCKDGTCIAAPTPQVCLGADAGPFLGDASPDAYSGGWTGPGSDAGLDAGSDASSDAGSDAG